MTHIQRGSRRLRRAGSWLLVAAVPVATACSEWAESPLAVQDDSTIEDPTLAPASIAVVSGDGQRGKVGEELAEPFVVRVTVAANAPATVEFAVTCTPTPGLAAVRLVLARAGHLWTMNADGTDLRRLTSGSVTDFRPVVSPDGSRIAFSRVPNRDDLWGHGGHSSVHVLELSSSEITRLSEYWVPDVAWAWSPDGTQIATRTGWNDGRIDLLRADGTRRSLMNGGGGTGDGRSPAWSPDGRTIAFYRYNHQVGAYEVWTMGADGTSQRFLRRSSASHASGGLYWASGGAELLFTDRESPARQWHHLWRMNADGSAAVRVLGPIGTDSWLGALSPDGRLLTMTRQWHGGGWGGEWRSDVYVVNVEDGSVVRVTADGLSSYADFLP